MNSGLKAVIKALKKYDNFLITSHINMEGDAVGSQLAMADILKKMGKTCHIVDNDPMPRQFDFLKGTRLAKTRLGGRDRIEAIVVVDCPVAERTGRVAGYFKKARAVINIDHHVSNARFGDVMWIEPGMSSGGEMLYHIYKALRLMIDKEAALNMYVAIATDTGNFSYESTSCETHRIACELIMAGVRPLWVANRLNENKTANDLLLLRDTLGTLRMHLSGRVALLYTSSRMLKKRGAEPASTDGFVNYARSLKTADIAVFLLEGPDKPGEVHVSFRSKGNVNVNRLAALFDGGGHPNAAGCMIKGTIQQAKRTVLEKIKRFLR